jgi:hypothetical protein
MHRPPSININHQWRSCGSHQIVIIDQAQSAPESPELKQCTQSEMKVEKSHPLNPMPRRSLSSSSMIWRLTNTGFKAEEQQAEKKRRASQGG